MSSQGTSFSSWASGYDGCGLQASLYEPVHRSVLEQLRLHAPSTGRMLDVGCGTGRLVQSTAQRHPLVIGVDSCLEMLIEGLPRTGAAGGGLVCARAEQLPFATGAFDVVTSTLSMRHWEDPERGFGELVRVLSGTGTLVIADTPGPGSVTPRRRLLGRRHASTGHLRLLAARYGLSVVDERAAPTLFSVQVLTARHR